MSAALALRADFDAAQREITAIYVATGRHQDALREAKAVQARRPKNALGHVLEAELYLAQNKLDLAEQTYRAALKKFDRPALALRTHSVLEAAGKRGEAEALAEDWIRRHPKDAVMLAHLGDLDLAARRYERAEARYRAALQRVPDNALLLNNLAWASNALKRPAALEYAERAHELAADNPAIMDTLGVILVESGQIERGLELQGRAADAASDAHQIRLNFAKSLLKTDRKTAARKELEQYFRGERRTFDVPLRPEGTSFQLSVWQALREIPFGETVSYGEIARRIGKANWPGARAVGAANGQNPIAIIVPCHRVIGKDGSLTGYGGGLPRKRWLLAHEGSLDVNGDSPQARLF